MGEISRAQRRADIKHVITELAFLFVDEAGRSAGRSPHALQLLLLVESVSLTQPAM